MESYYNFWKDFFGEWVSLKNSPTTGRWIALDTGDIICGRQSIEQLIVHGALSVERHIFVCDQLASGRDRSDTGFKRQQLLRPSSLPLVDPAFGYAMT
ncbi:MAG: hypothetical protein K8F25_14015 [Fimbriimonadaceae bacterium]|nr:hypothetical protein [Alphaproteobacteria bacterium]